MEHHLNFEQFLKKVGLTSDQLRDLLNKFSQFVGSLKSPEEKRAFLRSQVSIQQAAKSFHGQLTPEQLEEFLRTHLDDRNSVLIAIEENGETGD